MTHKYFCSKEQTAADVSNSVLQSQTDWLWDGEIKEIWKSESDHLIVRSFDCSDWGGGDRCGIEIETMFHVPVSFTVQETGKGFRYFTINGNNFIGIPNNLCKRGCTVFDNVSKSSLWEKVEYSNNAHICKFISYILIMRLGVPDMFVKTSIQNLYKV